MDNTIAEFILKNGCLSTSSQQNQAFKLMKSKKRDRWPEEIIRKRLEETSFKKLSAAQNDELLKQACYLHLEFLSYQNTVNLKNWEFCINSVSAGKPHITVENNVDLTGPPEGFTYINNYLPDDGIAIPDDPPMGCMCKNNCNVKTQCCPKQFGADHSSYYTNKKKLKVHLGTPIYECNKKCVCSSQCSNRVVQDGVLPLKDKKFCIFRTDNSRGWGVKAVNTIKKGTFVCLYVGEIITTEEADRRGKTYDKEGITYLFDLDFSETDNEECPYVVDAKMFGNISHFINHSCDPNLGVFGVWSNCLDRDLPMLALFALRDIAKGTELSFDYKRGNDQQQERDENLPLIKQKECLCGSANCRKYFF